MRRGKARTQKTAILLDSGKIAAMNKAMIRLIAILFATLSPVVMTSCQSPDAPAGRIGLTFANYSDRPVRITYRHPGTDITLQPGEMTHRYYDYSRNAFRAGMPSHMKLDGRAVTPFPVRSEGTPAMQTGGVVVTNRAVYQVATPNILAKNNPDNISMLYQWRLRDYGSMDVYRQRMDRLLTSFTGTPGYRDYERSSFHSPELIYLFKMDGQWSFGYSNSRIADPQTSKTSPPAGKTRPD